MMKILIYALMLIAAISADCIAEQTGMLKLPFSIDPNYNVTRVNGKSLPSLIPEAKPTSQFTIEVTRNGKKAFIFYWDGPPVRDLGPMAKKESWPVKFLGKDATITETSLFMGQKQEVLVLHCKLSKYTPVMIYSRDMSREEFDEMLASIRMK